jgi:hypothetical protein
MARVQVALLLLREPAAGPVLVAVLVMVKETVSPLLPILTELHATKIPALRAKVVKTEVAKVAPRSPPVQAVMRTTTPVSLAFAMVLATALRDRSLLELAAAISALVLAPVMPAGTALVVLPLSKQPVVTTAFSAMVLRSVTLQMAAACLAFLRLERVVEHAWSEPPAIPAVPAQGALL